MKKVTFFEGVIVALISSFLGSVGYFVLSSMFSDSFIIRLLISGFTFGYVLYLLSRSKEHIGRLTVMVIWSAITVATWVLWPTITLFVLIHLITIWLVRSMYFYSSLFAAFADLGLNGLSVATAFWAASYTGSLFLTIWCFFLTQALFVAIPTNIKQLVSGRSTSDGSDEFQRAYRDAEAAARKLSTQ